MRCPRDETNLTVERVEGVAAYLCEHCSGLWLEHSAVLALAANRGLEWPSTALITPAPGDEEINLSCPADHSAMVALSYKGIAIDICRRCSGIWLDGGELEQILGYGGESSDVPVAISSNDVDEAIDAFTDIFSGFDFGI